MTRHFRPSDRVSLIDCDDWPFSGIVVGVAIAVSRGGIGGKRQLCWVRFDGMAKGKLMRVESGRLELVA